MSKLVSGSGSPSIPWGGQVARAVRTFAELRYWDDLRFPNFSVDALVAGPNEGDRFSKNWIKLQAWNLTEFDAVIMLDVDTEVSRARLVPVLLWYAAPPKLTLRPVSPSSEETSCTSSDCQPQQLPPQAHTMNSLLRGLQG